MSDETWRKEKERKDGLRKKFDVNEVWKKIDDEEKVEPEVNEQPGWKTVRIFVSSTFRDFHEEREVLVKQVFAELREWCEERHLHLIDCDLRWGVPKETTSELTVKTCMEEIKRCYEDNKAPFFVNMTCKRVGWIPLQEEIPSALLQSYRLEFGLSVTEMEIVYAAYRIYNPNALFMIRDESFIKEISNPNIENEFVDELKPNADEKLETLKKKIKDRFSDRVFTYACKYEEKDGRPKLKLDESFSETVKKFFKDRIGQQYPPVKKELDPFVQANNNHKAYMRGQCEINIGGDQQSKRNVIIGREDVLQEIFDYIGADAPGYPKVIVGDAGAGKSSIMAKAALDVMEKVEKKELLRNGCVWKVFYHFVGAVPNSTSLLEILRRLLKELQPAAELPSSKDEAVQTVSTELANESQKPIIIFIDAINQIDHDPKLKSFSWLPQNLSCNVRCVLSMIAGSEPDVVLSERKDIPKYRIPDLKLSKQMKIIENYLGLFNKKLDQNQMVALLDKQAARNPLWLRIACEEMRIHGEFETVDVTIKNLEETLPNLLKQVLHRFEKESDPVLLISTLCLLEVSQFGLLETELLEILADKENLQYRENCREETAEVLKEREKGSRLPAFEWACIYRNLRTFLRPYGNRSEGRLGFYHPSLSEVVQELYLDKQSKEKNEKQSKEKNEKLSKEKNEKQSKEKNEKQSKEKNENKRWWWHKKLADFYQQSKAYDRKVEEYPYHLIELKKLAKDDNETKHWCQQLEEFLRDPEAFKRLFDDEFSELMLNYWRETGDEKYTKMTSSYLKEIENMKENADNIPEKLTERIEYISRLLIQAGKYEEGLVLAEDCLTYLNKFKSRYDPQEMDEKLMYLYGHIGHIKILLLPTTEKASDIPALEEVIKYHRDAIDLNRKIAKDKEDKKYKKYLALQLIKTAYARGGIASRCKLFSFSTLLIRDKMRNEMMSQGLAEVKEAVKIYTEIQDCGHVLEAYLTEGTMHRGDKKKQLEIYSETKKKCADLIGEKSPLMCRLCFNIGVVHAVAGDDNKAYDSYKEAYVTAKEIYGSLHVKTEKYKKELLKYAKVAKKRIENIELL